MLALLKRSPPSRNAILKNVFHSDVMVTSPVLSYTYLEEVINLAKCYLHLVQSGENIIDAVSHVLKPYHFIKQISMIKI